MGLFSSISDWTKSNYEKKITRMREQGKCPECKGMGLNAYVLYDYVGFGSYDFNHCPGCNGSGSFSDWEAQRIE